MKERLQTRQLEQMAKEIENLDERQLEAGLGVILKDTLQYLLTAPRSDDSTFKEMVYEVMAGERRDTLPQWRLLYVDPNDPVPTGIVAAAAKGKFNLNALKNVKIQHEWTIYPARRFLKKFNVKLKKNICGKGGPYEQFKNGMLGQAALPTTIATTILTVGFSAATVWYPLAVYVGILILRTGLATYCDKK
jgi:hypothetical protein